MKKFLLSVFCFTFAFFAFAGIASAESQILAGFNFEDAAKRAVTDFTSGFYTADDGLTQNKDISEIKLNGSAFTAFVNGSGGSGTSAPNANSWDSGMDTKYWSMSFSTTGYKDLKLSSKQYGSATGPRDFKVQWSIDESTWTDVAGTSITVNTNWTSGSLTNIALPAEVEDQAIVHLRWIMTSNTSVGGGTVGTSGTNRIDDIFIGGMKTLYTLNYSAGANGSLAGITNQTVYYQDDGTAITALPDPDYHFLDWSDGSFSNPRTDLAVTENIDVTANFAFNAPFVNCGDTYWYDEYGHQTVQIGTQCWFKENLKYLPSVVPPNIGSTTDPYYYVYGYSGTNVNEAKATANYSTHGVLYNYPASLSACPTGFHTATDNDYKIMEMFLGLSQAEADSEDWRGTNEGSKMKSDTLWNGTNQSGFSATPSGFRSNSNTFNVLNVDNYIWTLDQKDVNRSWARAFITGQSKIRRYFYNKELGFSVRCVQNDYTLTYTAGANGSITGVTPQNVNHGDDGTAVTAVSNSGYHFVDWSDGSVVNPRTDLAVTGDITVTANFAVDPPVVSPTPSAGGRRPGYKVQNVQEEQEENAQKAPFTDIDGSWAEDYINELYNAGYIQGYDDNTFRPDEYIKRSEAVKMIAVYFDENIDDSYCEAGLYSDVLCSQWYGGFISYLTGKGVLEGYGEGIFKPGKNITRAETLKIMLFAKALQNTNIDEVENPFSDIVIEDWYYNIAVIGHKLSIIEGYEDGTFGPNKPVTRAEFAKIFTEIYLL